MNDYIWLVIMRDFSKDDRGQTKISSAFTNREAAAEYRDHVESEYDETVITQRNLYNENPAGKMPHQKK